MSSAVHSRLSYVLRRDTYAMVLLVCGDTEVASWPLTGPGRPDLAVVDELMRLRLTARRLDCSLRLREVCAELSELLDLLGLGEILGFQAGGETESGE
ncbi:MAG: hypothetical protein ACRDTG_29350 [Pseudonocardiaceae bacterium]